MLLLWTAVKSRRNCRAFYYSPTEILVATINASEVPAERQTFQRNFQCITHPGRELERVKPKPALMLSISQ
jgi:hypothetical protein